MNIIQVIKVKRSYFTGEPIIGYYNPRLYQFE